MEMCTHKIQRFCQLDVYSSPEKSRWETSHKFLIMSFHKQSVHSPMESGRVLVSGYFLIVSVIGHVCSLLIYSFKSKVSELMVLFL